MKKIITSVAMVSLLLVGANTVSATCATSAAVNYELSSNSAEWDDILDDYEAYVTKYISFMKKAQNGDLTAMADAASLLSKATSLYDKLDSASDELTTSQMARLARIAAKMADAAADMAM